MLLRSLEPEEWGRMVCVGLQCSFRGVCDCALCAPSNVLGCSSVFFVFDAAGLSSMDVKLVFVSCSFLQSHASWVVYVRRTPANVLRPLGRMGDPFWQVIHRTLVASNRPHYANHKSRRPSGSCCSRLCIPILRSNASPSHLFKCPEHHSWNVSLQTSVLTQLIRDRSSNSYQHYESSH